MADFNAYPQPRCRDTQVPQARIESAIIAVLECVRRRAHLRDYITEEFLLMILHRGAEMFKKEPMLLEVELTNGVIVGDLHGCFIDLVLAFADAGLPPSSEYLFLGDYVNKGPMQIELFLLILLVKMRYPYSVYMLRGNHETYDVCASYDFFEACDSEYPDTTVHLLFVQVFNLMPVAAIVNDTVLCCHGGISQWMTSRRSIRNLPRPGHAKCMKLLENCLLNDILWADPDPRQKKPFLPSTRGTAYTFNEAGLKAVLGAVRCETLVRGHSPILTGVEENIPGRCYTVQTACFGNSDRSYGAIFLVRESDRPGKYDFTSKAHSYNLEQMEEMLTAESAILIRAFRDRLFSLPFYSMIHDKRSNEVCELCLVGTPKWWFTSASLVSHEDIADWVFRNAAHLIETDRRFEFAHRSLHYESALHCAVSCFPQYFDVIHLKGGTFRVGVTDKEWTFIQSNHMDAVLHTKPVSLEVSFTGLELDPHEIHRRPVDEQEVDKPKGLMKLLKKAKIAYSDVKKRTSIMQKVAKLFGHAQRPQSYRYGTTAVQNDATPLSEMVMEERAEVDNAEGDGTGGPEAAEARALDDARARESDRRGAQSSLPKRRDASTSRRPEVLTCRRLATRPSGKAGGEPPPRGALPPRVFDTTR